MYRIGEDCLALISIQHTNGVMDAEILSKDTFVLTFHNDVDISESMLKKIRELTGGEVVGVHFSAKNTLLFKRVDKSFTYIVPTTSMYCEQCDTNFEVDRAKYGKLESGELVDECDKGHKCVVVTP